MDYYFIIKSVHLYTALFSILGFVLRFFWKTTGNQLLDKKLVKVLPHINDTLLLSAAVYLSAMSGFYPWVEAWLGFKVILLIGYIVAGMIALKASASKKANNMAFLLALVCVSAIIALALFRPNF